MSTRRLPQRLKPVALAALLALGASGLNAAPRTFTGGSSFWDVVANWSGGLLPGAADDALLGAFNTEVRTSFTINSFIGTGSLTVSAGTLSFAAASSIGALNLTGGTLAGAGSLVVAGPSTWTSGAMTGTGATTFASDLALSGNGLRDITSGRTVNFNGTTTWSNATASQGRIRTGSSASLNNTGTWLDQNNFANQISQDFGGPASTFVNTGVYTKTGTGTTTIAIRFDNTFNNVSGGDVAVNAGTLLLTGGGTSNGSFSGQAGTTIGFSGHTLQAGGIVSSFGAVEFSGGSGNNTVAGGYNVAVGTSFTSGTTTFTGGIANVGATLTANGGTGVFNQNQALNVDNLVITNGGGLTFNNTGGVVTSTLTFNSGTLAGTANVVVAGAVSWASGTMTGSGTTTLFGDLALSGNGLRDISTGRTVNFNGTTTWSNAAVSQGRIRTGSNATLNNNGTWLDQNNLNNQISQDLGGPASTFVNAGTYTKSGTATTNIGIGFNNTRSGAGTGVVNVDAGTLLLSGGGTSNGSFAGAGILEFGGGTHTLQAASSIANPNVVFSGGTTTLAGSYNASGSTTVGGGTANFTGTVANSGGALILNGGGAANFSNSAGVQFSSLNLQSGTIGGTQAVTFTGPSTWTTGAMTDAGITSFAGSLALSGNGLKDITSGRSVNFNGTTTWSNATASQGRIRTGSTASLNNTGTWLDQNNFANQISQDFGGPASTFVNTGTYTKSGTATTNIGIGFNNTRSGAGTGVVNVNAGTLQLSGGGTSTGSFAGGGTLEFGGGTHTLTATSSVGNTNVGFSGGTTTLAGAYSASGSTAFTGGTANFTGTVATSGGALSFSTSGGTANFSNSAGVQFASLNMQAGTIGGSQSVTINGPSTWATGGMTDAGTTTFAGDVALNGNGLKDITNGRIVNFNGTTTWANATAGQGRLRTGSSARLNNNGTWLDQNNFNNSINPDFGGPASTFVNAGTYTKSGAATTAIFIGFDNTRSGAGTGVVNVNAGTLQLSGGGTSTGSFAGAGTLEFGGGTHTLTATSSVGNTNVGFSGGTTTLAGAYSASGSTAFTGGTANFTGTVANSGGALTFSASGGTANFSNSAGVQFASLNMQAGTIGGSQSVTFNGPSTWATGGMTDAGTTTFAGDVALNGNGLKDITNGRIVNFNGTTTWANATAGQGRLRTGSSARLNNNGTWLDQNNFNNSINPDFGGPASTFVNAGTYTKSGTATTAVFIGFDNAASGAVNVNTGALQLSAGGSSSGAFALANGTTLEFNSGTYTLGGSVAGPVGSRLLVNGGTLTNTSAKTFGGLLEVSAGTFDSVAGFTTASYTQSAGIVGGVGTVTVSGPATWTAGGMTDAGATTFSGSLALGTNGLKDINSGRTVNFNGTTTWTNATAGQGRIRTGSGARLNNNGTWLDQNNFNNSINPDFGGPASTFVNAGTYTKSGTATTNIAIGFDNTAGGSVNLNTGILQLSAGGSSSGVFALANGTTLEFSSGNYTLGGSLTGTAGVRLLASGGTLTNTSAKTFGGLLEVTSGTFDNDAGFTTASYTQSAGTVGGVGALTASGAATWTAGLMTEAGTTTFSGNLALSTTGLKDITNGRIVNFNGTTTWGTASVNGGAIRTGTTATLNNNGTWLDQNGLSNNISQQFGGPASSFVNAGTYTKSGAGTTTINIGFSNTGTVNVNAGTLTLGGGLSNFSGTTLTGGSFNVTGASTFSFAGANVVTNAAGITLDGAGSQFLNASGATNGLVNLASNTAAGSFTIRNGRNFATLGAFNNAGVVNVGPSSTFTGGGLFTNQPNGQLQMAGGNYAGLSLANAGIVSGFGAVAPVVSNSGTVRASGGTLTLTGGALGATGTVLVDTGATLALGAASTARNLTHNGTLLALGTNNITVFNDYDSANFGVGNSFDRRAGVSGTGQILASGTTQQTLSGALITGGNTGTATLALPNIRVGQGGFNSSFTINNTGVGGPTLRGALVTTGISNAGLSGSGVTAQNWGAVSQFGPGQTFSVSFDPSFGQALSGQVLQVVNNFDNVAGQTLSFTGQAFNLASASAATPSPVVFANQRVGGTLSQALTISNTAPNNGFSESLNATVTANGTATAGGSFSLLAAGASNSALFVGVSTSTAGAKSGTATIALASDGTGTSGFSPLTLTSQNVAVSGDVYRLASASAVTPSPVVLANQRIGGTLTQALTFTNIAAADGFSERLNATIAASGNATAGGAFNLLAAGASSSALFVGVNTGSAGAKSGTATIALASDGTGTSGFSPLALLGQQVQVSGDVYRLASASAAAPNPVVLANQRVGGTLSQALSLTNTAANDSFSERLNASIAASGAATAGGGFSLLAAGATSNALFVGVDTSTAGAKSGTATLSLASDGTGTSGFSPLALAGQNVSVSGNVYRLAQASAVTPATVVLGNVRAGGVLTQALSLSNLAAADGFSESLNASISGSSGILTGGSFVGLAAGASSNSLFVSIDSSTPGLRSGIATIALASNGSGSSGLADFNLGTQTVNVSATIYRLASASNATPNPALLADQRVGGTLTQALSLSNTAAPDSFSERLSATISASGGATAGGTFSLLAAGASSSALFVGVDTSTAGAKSGNALISLTSDGAGTSGFGSLAIASQNVAVSGNVFRLAVPVVSTAPVTLLGRVGDTLAAAQIGVTNNAPDLFTERLNASITGAPAGLSAGPALLGLAPNASGSLALSLATATAGDFSGTASVGLVSSSAGTTSGAPDFNLGAVNVAVNARVYAPAVAQLPVTVVNFGTVRVGDSVAARTVTVSNAATGALTDTLSATLGGGGAPFTASGTVAGLAAGSSSAALQVQLNTASAGVFNGNASVSLLSQNPELADLTLSPVGITLQGQVNNLASATLAQAGGSGIFSGAASSYTLDFGTVFTDASSLTGALSLANAALGTADALAGSWNLAALASGPFSVAGFQAFTGLAAGNQLAGLTVNFELGTEGSFSRTVVLNGFSTNGSGPDLALNPITLQLQGTVVAIPEPGTYLMMAVGVLAMGSIARRKLRARQG